MSDDGSYATIHEGTSARRPSFVSEYTVARGDQAATADVKIPETIEGPMERWGSHTPSGGGWRPNSDYEAFPPEEQGQGVLFHRTRPNISGWYGTGDSMLNAEALAGAVNQSIKHTGMFPRRDTTLSADSGKAVANFIDKPEIKDDATFLDNEDSKKYGAILARRNVSFNHRMLGNNPTAHTYRGDNGLRWATDEERAAAKGALRELPKYKAIYKAMEEGRQWDPNSISAFRDRANKKVAAPKPKRVKVDPNQLELDLS
jgi:hypothetical protein